MLSTVAAGEISQTSARKGTHSQSQTIHNRNKSCLLDFLIY